MTYADVTGDPFAVGPPVPSGHTCRACHSPVEHDDAYCRVCGSVGPTSTARRPAQATVRSAPAAPVPVEVSGSRLLGGVLAVAGLLLVVGTQLDWLRVGFSPFEVGFSPVFSDVWPIVFGAVVLGLIGLSALTAPMRIPAAGWLAALVVASGVAIYLIREVGELRTAIAGADAMLSAGLGMGVWVCGAGVAAALIAAAAGWTADRT